MHFFKHLFLNNSRKVERTVLRGSMYGYILYNYHIISNLENQH